MYALVAMLLSRGTRAFAGAAAAAGTVPSNTGSSAAERGDEGTSGNLAVADNDDTLSTPEGRAAAAAFAARVAADAAAQRENDNNNSSSNSSSIRNTKNNVVDVNGAAAGGRGGGGAAGGRRGGGAAGGGGLAARAVSGSINWLQLACVAVALSTVVAFIYAPVVSTDVFHQAPISGREWGVVGAALAVYTLLGQVVWKLFLRPR